MSNGGQRQEPDWDAWGGYMDSKKRKLDVQFNAGISTDASNIFDGISIFINGYTDPSADKLRRIMQENGGRCHVYISSDTTHVIATNLATTKVLKLKPNDKVVRPEWITDSFIAGKLLPDIDYLLCGRQQGCGSLDKFMPKSSTNPIQSLNPEKPQVVAAKASNAPLKVTDSGFLEAFYARSRLHFLSTWGQEMKRLVQQLKTNSNGTFIGRNKLIEYKDKGDTCINEFNLQPKERVFMHLDMDCFFVSVGLRSRPELRGRPVVVTHSKGKGPVESDDNKSDFVSFAEIASCSYEARKAKVSNGMLLGNAKKLCPNLVPISYDFEQYHEVSKSLYEIVTSYTFDVEAVSCDELYIDISELIRTFRLSPLDIASVLRNHIKDKTNCPASAGIGHNMLIARLATRKAKPNGQYYVSQTDVASFMLERKLGDLPGVGRQTCEKLEMKFGNIEKCADLQLIPLGSLIKEFGPKAGKQLADASHGIDTRDIKCYIERKSVSCDINYGVRFNTIEDVKKFLIDLATEMQRRLNVIDMTGRQLLLKLLVRAEDAPINPKKFMGCGQCDSYNRSINLQTATADSNIIAKEAIALFRQLNLVITDVRGIGLSMHKLQSKVKTNKPGSIAKFLCKPGSSEIGSKQKLEMNQEFLEALPSDIRSEVGKEYFSSSEVQMNEIPIDTNEQHKVPIMVNVDTFHQPSADGNVEWKDQLSTAEPLDVTNRPATTLKKKVKSLRGAVSYDDVKEVLRNWVETVFEPTDDEVSEIVEYFASLVSNSLERTYVLLRIFHRFAERSKSVSWLNSYKTTLAAVQAACTVSCGTILVDLPGAPAK